MHHRRRRLSRSARHVKRSLMGAESVCDPKIPKFSRSFSGRPSAHSLPLFAAKGRILAGFQGGEKDRASSFASSSSCMAPLSHLPRPNFDEGTWLGVCPRLPFKARFCHSCVDPTEFWEFFDPSEVLMRHAIRSNKAKSSELTHLLICPFCVLDSFQFSVAALTNIR